MSDTIYSQMLPNAIEVINDAIMSGQPFLILEGCTDISIYQKISKNLGKEVVLKPVELIDGYSSGCNNVIKLINDLEENELSSSLVKGNIIGIIDKDVRDYRGEIPSSANIITMKFYSIESHFVCEESIGKCFASASNSPINEGIKQISKEIYHEFILKSKILFLASLDALKKSIDVRYENIFSYSNSFEILKNEDFKRKIQDREEDLLAFASENSIELDDFSIKKIIKGKVLFDFFCKEIHFFIKNFSLDCNSFLSNKCIYCHDGFRDKCLYNIKTKLTDQAVKSIIKTDIPMREFSYLFEDIRRKINA